MSEATIEDLREAFVANRFKRDVRESSFATALGTIKFLRKLVVQCKYDNIIGLLNILSKNGMRLAEAEPSELVIRNVLLMVCKLAREENSRIIIGDEPISPYDSLNNLWKENEKSGPANVKDLRRGLISALNEVATEMESCRESIACQALELVQPQDVLIVHSLKDSPAMSHFLHNVRKSRVHSVVSNSDFDVVPKFASPMELCDVASKMCEATKVLLPGVAVFSDGSCMVPAGGLSICLAAQRHAVPVYVLAAFYKITPYFVPDSYTVNPHLKPNLPFSLARTFTGKVDVVQPSFDVVPASLIALYVSNSATLLPSHIYRLIGDYYHPEDVAGF